MIPLHDALPGALAALLHNVPLSEGKVAFAWRAAVGSGLARASSVQLTGAGALNIEVANPHWGREVERSRTVILRRLETLLGAGAVRSMSVRVRPPASAERRHEA